MRITKKNQRERNAAFLADTRDDLSRLTTTEEIMQLIGEKLAVFLNITAVYFVEIDEREMGARLQYIWPHAGDQAQPVETIYLPDFYINEILNAYRKSEAVVVHDARDDQRIGSAAGNTVKAGSGIGVPFHHLGEWKFVLGVLDKQPRNWRNDEITLVGELARHFFPALERARAEETLRRREIEMVRVQQIGNVAGIDIDVANGFRGWRSPEYIRLHGLPPDTTVETHEDWLRRLHPDDRERANAIMEKALAGTEASYQSEYRIIRPNDGQVRWILAKVDIERDAESRPLRLVGAHIDITDRKQTEEALRKSQAKYRSLFQSLNDGFAVCELIRNGEGIAVDWRWLELNPAFEKLTGLTYENTVGKLMTEVLSGPDEWWLRSYEMIINTGEAVRFEHYVPQIKRWLDIKAFPYGENRFAVLYDDITVRKQNEEALRMANQRKDEFLATLAHELRNPLAPIRYAAMYSQSPDVAKEDLQRCNEVIVRQVEHMGRLLDDLLDVSRITKGKLTLRKELLLLNDILAAAVETARPLIEARGHTLQIEVPESSCYIEVDPVRFEQILSNLLTNAAKYTDKGGHIQVKAKLENGKTLISVKDNGIGISNGQLLQLFQMFSQVSSAIERSEGGLGIGLALVRGLVLLHDGTIEGYSEGLGRGSEFIVTLPVKKNEQEHTAGEHAGAASVRPVRILVIDDNRDNADLCSMLLKSAKHEVRTAYSGKEGLSIAPGFTPDFMLLDIGMPEMNGYEVAQQVRAAEWGKNVVLVAITGWGQEEDKRKAFAAGFNHHLTKPFDAKSLKEILNRHSARHRAQDAG